jgi:hypothetical protein
MFRGAIAAVALCALILTTRPALAEDDASTPKGAAGLFFKAMEKGDVATAKTMVVGTDKQVAVLDVLVPFVSSLKQLEASALKKWGEEGRKAITAGPGGSGGMDFAGELKNAKEEVTGDAATITSGKDPKKDPMRLKKVDGKWKLDMGSLQAEKMDDPGARRTITAVSDLAKSTAKEIDDGKYASAEEAKQSMTAKLMALLTGGGAGAPPATGAEPKK